MRLPLKFWFGCRSKSNSSIFSLSWRNFRLFVEYFVPSDAPFLNFRKNWKFLWAPRASSNWQTGLFLCSCRMRCWSKLDSLLTKPIEMCIRFLFLNTFALEIHRTKQIKSQKIWKISFLACFFTIFSFKLIKSSWVNRVLWCKFCLITCSEKYKNLRVLISAFKRSSSRFCLIILLEIRQGMKMWVQKHSQKIPAN